jgi:type IV secretory pathway TrbF-like protein
MRIDIFHHFSPDEVLNRLDSIEDKLDQILEGEQIIMSMETDALDQAEAAAAANAAADDSAEQLLVTLSKMVADLKANTTDPATVARITALATAIKDRAERLGTAVAANTPAATT